MKVVWLFDDKAFEVLRGGLLLVNFPKLKRLMEIKVQKVEAGYNPADCARVVKYTFDENSGTVVKEVLIGSNYDSENDALEALSENGLENFSQNEFDKMALNRFISFIDHSKPDYLLIPLFRQRKWLRENTLTPYWSCSGHFSKKSSSGGYISLSGSHDNLLKVKEHLITKNKVADIAYLVAPGEDSIFLHPVLSLRWMVKTKSCPDKGVDNIKALLLTNAFDF